jgi:hypothetical protein
VGLWLLAALAGAKATPQISAQQRPPLMSFPTTLEVSGVVVDAVTGHPIAGALVSTVSPHDWGKRSSSSRYNVLPPKSRPAEAAVEALDPEKQQLTDTNGHFKFAPMKLEQGQPFYISKSGYLAPDSRGSSVSYTKVSVMPAMGDLRFTLNPEAEVRGKVSASGGGPLPNVQATLYRVRYTLGRPSWIYFDQQRTDTNGNYRFGELPAGTYFVVTQWLLDNDPITPDSTNCNDGNFQPEGGFPPHAEPGVLDFRVAKPIVLTEGKHATADLKLQHQVFHPVTIPNDPKLRNGLVEIVDRNGRSLQIPLNPGARCTRDLHPKGDLQKSTINLPDGSYRFERRGAYSLDDPFETGGAKQPLYLGGYAYVTVAGKPVIVTLPAIAEDATPRMQIRVHREAIASPSDASAIDLCSVRGRPQVGSFSSSGRKLPPSFQVSLLPVDSFGGEGSKLQETQKDVDLYESTGLRPGRYWVQTQGLDHGYVSAITANGRDLMQHPLEIGMNARSAPLEITVRSDCGRIHFEKPWMRPPAGAMLADAVGIVDPWFEVLVPQFIAAAPYGQISAQRTMMEKGMAESITLGNLPPGHYKLFETFDEHVVAYFSPADLDRRLGPGRDVWLKAGEQADLAIHDLSR